MAIELGKQEIRLNSFCAKGTIRLKWTFNVPEKRTLVGLSNLTAYFKIKSWRAQHTARGPNVARKSL